MFQYMTQNRQAMPFPRKVQMQRKSYVLQVDKISSERRKEEAGHSGEDEGQDGSH